MSYRQTRRDIIDTVAVLRQVILHFHPTALVVLLSIRTSSTSRTILACIILCYGTYRTFVTRSNGPFLASIAFAIHVEHSRTTTNFALHHRPDTGIKRQPLKLLDS